MDELPLNLVQGDNILTIEVAGYYVNSFYLMKQPSFLQAEVSVEEKIRCATGWKEDFEAREDECSIQRVQRYSFCLLYTSCPSAIPPTTGSFMSCVTLLRARIR